MGNSNTDYTKVIAGLKAETQHPATTVLFNAFIDCGKAVKMEQTIEDHIPLLKEAGITKDDLKASGTDPVLWNVITMVTNAAIVENYRSQGEVHFPGTWDVKTFKQGHSKLMGEPKKFIEKLQTARGAFQAKLRTAWKNYEASLKGEPAKRAKKTAYQFAAEQSAEILARFKKSQVDQLGDFSEDIKVWKKISDAAKASHKNSEKS